LRGFTIDAQIFVKVLNFNKVSTREICHFDEGEIASREQRIVNYV